MSAVVDQISHLGVLVDAVRSGKCILFLGAGINASPPETSVYKYPPQEQPASTKALAQILAEKCGYRKLLGLNEDADLDLQRVSLCFETDKMFRRKVLVDELKRLLVDGKKPSPALKMLADLPFRIFVTTNYDLLLDEALEKSGTDKKCKTIIYDPDKDDKHRPTENPLEDPTPENPIVFKMHGDLSQDESIVITDEDYIRFIMRMGDKDKYNPIPEIVRFDMQRWPILFVGYSLRDYNLRLLFRTLRWHLDSAKVPPAFSVDLLPDLLIQKVYENEKGLVAFVVEDIWTFVPWLYEQVTGKEYGHV